MLHLGDNVTIQFGSVSILEQVCIAEIGLLRKDDRSRCYCHVFWALCSVLNLLFRKGVWRDNDTAVSKVPL